MATTPPPPSFLRLPPTPRHGSGYDQYEPYSTRHSARLASQRTSTDTRTTPPPSFPISQARGTSRTKKQKTAETETLSPPGSPNTPRKKMSARGRVATQSLDDPDSFNIHPHPFRATLTEGMLPTPAKTPRKKTVDNAGSAARALFPPSNQKKKKKHTGFSLDSFTDDPSQNQSIQIYTDSRDRIPEVDETEGNPFYKKPPTTTNPRPSRRKTGGREKEVDEALEREDGMVYVFRGKKIFRKFTNDIGSDEEDDDDLGLLASRPDLMNPSLLGRTRPLTRASIKPRVLFPSANHRAVQEAYEDDADEEAATDIEDHILDDADSTDDVYQTADIHSQQRPATPPPSSIATPPSPGASVRSLRSRSKREDLDGRTPTAPETKRKHISPFDGWLRKKQPPSVIGSKPKKRDAETVGSPEGPVSKKTRGNRTTVPSS
ncbi:hypothetical protein BDW59DRAFT_59673 [Aspergillus cavernicola]|uniref:Uncharacterized protein n=1 Tax=Aspergillus cavernicola TaxID=176166 RepID=A0ABR4IGZ8_9EURO